MYVPPEFQADAFNCPLCKAYSDQRWYTVQARINATIGDDLHELQICKCRHCGNYSIWYAQQMIYPGISNAPFSHPDMPEGIKGDYEEARSIASQSPRGAAALLRLVIQKLMIVLGEKGKDRKIRFRTRKARHRRSSRRGTARATDIVR